ncbi:MAG: hypothetical protein ACRC5H_08135 [Treponemataceae bacterium]
MRDKNQSKDVHRSKKRKNFKDTQQNKKKTIDYPVKKIDFPKVACAKCDQIIQDITSALTDKTTGTPAHFDCILQFLNETEKLGANEKIMYIGQGRFGVLHFENMHDLRRFTINRIIEWESRENKPAWRKEISDLAIK